MASLQRLAVVLLGVASVGGGERLLYGSIHVADGYTSSFVSGGSSDARLRHAHNLPMSVDVGNSSRPMPSGAAVKGEAFRRGVSVNGVLMVDNFTGGLLPEYISAYIAGCSFPDTAGNLMEELDLTVWTAAGGGPLASLIFKIIFAVNAGRLFCFTRYRERSGIDGEVGWSNWRQAEASPIFDANGIAVAFEASGEPLFSLGWRFSFHGLATSRPHLKIVLSGHPLINVTRDREASHSRPILTNNLPTSVDAGNGSIFPLSFPAMEGEALPREASVTEAILLLSTKVRDAALFIGHLSALIGMLNATTWTAAGRGSDSNELLLFNITFAVSSGGRLFCLSRYRASSVVGSEGGWSNWQQAEARFIESDHQIVEFKASADPRLTDLVYPSKEYRPWFSPGWSFIFDWRTGPFQRLQIRLFGCPLRSVAGINLELEPSIAQDLATSVDAGNATVPVRSGAAVGGEALPRGISVDFDRKLRIVAQSKLLEELVTHLADAVNDTAGALMAELDGTIWSAIGGFGPFKSVTFRVSFIVNAGRLFCFTRYVRYSRLGVWSDWSNWRQTEARPVFDADGTATGFEASAEPEFSPGWMFLVSRRQELDLNIKLSGYTLDIRSMTKSYEELRW